MIPRPNRIKNLIGLVFGRLTVKGMRDRTPSGKIRWTCRCACGKEKDICSSSLKSGATKSCGCLNVETVLSMALKHGHTRGKKSSPEFSVWTQMIVRCTNPRNIGWDDYGGRGIAVCQRWKDSFQNFLDDMGARPSISHSIDHIDNDGNYEPSDCKWATKREQAINRRPRSVCWHGHLLTEDNTIGVRRRCLICLKESQAQYKKNRKKYPFPEKLLAHQKVAKAIIDGKIQRQPCEVCHNTKALAHHEDYDKPLAVNWLCRSHHQKRHNNMKITWEQ